MPKNTLTGLKCNILRTDEARLFFLGLDSLSDNPPNTEFKPQYTVKHGDASIMIWGCFSYYVLGLFIAFEGSWISLSTFKYLEVMLPYAKEEMPLKWVFQQDNNPKHTSKRAASWFQTNKINVMEWPAQSPDLYPIENLWGDIKNAVSEAKPRNAEELYVVQSSWAGKPVHRCQTPCNTDVKQFSETMAIQLNVSSVIHKKAKNSSSFLFIQ